MGGPSSKQMIKVLCCLLFFSLVSGGGLLPTTFSFAFESEKTGRVLVVAFKDGLPAAGVSFNTPTGIKKTNEYGVLNTVEKINVETLYEEIDTGEKIKFKVFSDDETQITINILSNKKISSQVIEPKVAEKQKINTELSKKSLQIKVLNLVGEPIVDATVLISGFNSIFKTNKEGKVLITDINTNEPNLSIFHPDFQTRIVSDIKFLDESTKIISVKLEKAKAVLEDVVVLAPQIKGSNSALIEIRKKSSSVSDVLGAEQMARSGDSDAASSLRRVTGLTLVGGKYVYVRGLGERYSGVQMNNFSLPSPEPSRRVVPLDLFPTAIMESIVVQKSYSPDLSAEFGGGIIQLKTKTIPDSFFLKSTISTNYEGHGDYLTYQGGGLDWLGIDDGTRKLPQSIKDKIILGKKLEVNVAGFDGGVSSEELKAMGQDFTNKYNATQGTERSLPGLSITSGNSWGREDFKFGISGSFLYGQTINGFERVNKNFSVGLNEKLELDSLKRSNITEIDTRLTGSIDLGVNIASDHKVTASNFILRNTTKLTQESVTDNVSTPSIESLVLDFPERQLITNQVKGEHSFGKDSENPISLDWRIGNSDARRESYDRRELNFLATDNKKSILDNQSGNRRIFSDLYDKSQEIGLNLGFGIKNENSREIAKFKVGGLINNKKRNSEMSRYFFSSSNMTVDKQNESSDPEVIFSKENIKNGSYVLKNITSDADNYQGEQLVSAYYFLSELDFFENLSFQLGARFENSVQDVKTYKYFDKSNPTSVSQIKMQDMLPSYSLVWKPNEKWRGRLAYSETLARPDFREMSTVGFIDDETGFIVQGNAYLNGTVIKNLDHRWEYYFTNDEYISWGLFYKSFVNPIEVLFLPGVNKIQSFSNAKGAKNFGIEIEGRMNFRYLSRFLRRWSLLANISYIQSNILLDSETLATQTSLSRPLQGQSPYTANLQIQYDRPSLGFAGTLSYNVIGKRITQVGTNGIPDSYEQPIHQLDLLLSEKIDESWTVSFRARNILDPEIKTTQLDEVVRSQKRGRLFSLVLGAVF